MGAELRAMVREAVYVAPITDIHTHLFDPIFGAHCSAGIDDLLTYHYLVAETFRLSAVDPLEFGAWPRARRADHVWDTLFVRHTPLSEVARSVLTVLSTLGLDVNEKRLDVHREWFAARDAATQMDAVFAASGVESVVMTNDPFDEVERAVWDSSPRRDARFHAALRLDALLNGWDTAWPRLRAWGYSVDADFDGCSEEVRRFLVTEARRMKALYCAVSLPPTWTLDDVSGRLIERCVVPACTELGIPLALMIGVRRGVNPALGLAGDGVGRADLGGLETLCARYPRQRFMSTVLSLENQHELIVLARKFGNLLPFGCWWFVNNPVVIAPLTRLRLQMLGPSFIPQHSDCRVLEQLIGKWLHFKPLLVDVLVEAYEGLEETGYRVTREVVERDARALLGGHFWDFVR